MNGYDNTIYLLYVDDEAILLKLTKLYLERTGNFIVDTASSAKEALTMIQKQTYDTIISDYQMPEMDGLEFLRTLRAEGNNIPFIIFTGQGREEVAIEALNAGADYYLQKGGKPDVQFGELQNFVIQAVKKNRAEASAVENEKALLELINAFPNPAFLLDSHGKIITINQNAIKSVNKFMDVSENTSFIGKTAGDLLPPEVAGKRCNTIKKAIVTGKKVECYEEYCGQIFKCYITPHFDNNSILKNIAFFQINITTRRKAKEVIHQKNADLEASYKKLQSKDQELRQNLEELMQSQQQLQNNESRLSEIINFLPDATLAIDNKGVVIAWNRAIEQMTGTSASEMLGKGNYEYALPFYGRRRPIQIDLVLQKEISYPVMPCEDMENASAEAFLPNFRGSEGTYLWFTASTLYDTDGRITGAIESIRDITVKKQAEIALKTVNEKLNLLSSITRHDTLNQITILMAYEELLKEEIEDEKARDYLETMITTTKMIEKQIGFTRDYQDLGVNNPTWQSVESVVHPLATHATYKPIKVKIDTGKLEIFADPMLYKAFHNIFENSVRYGEHLTEINVFFYENQGQGVLVIEDDGVGIADNMKESIFDRGVGKNTGLGLFLTKKILGITGISIAETGTEGKGARFEIRLSENDWRIWDQS